ncbi:MAG: hypothetical protein VW270_10675 [Candidatus Poseidoniales archaeon]|jgi:hypothetical protein
MITGLFVGFAAIATAYSMWRVYDIFFRPDEEETPSVSYYHDSEILEEPQVGIKFQIEDPQGVDADDTLEVVNEWIQNDDPNIISGEYQIKVSTLSDVGIVEISGDASPLILDSYENVEFPYVDGDSNLEWIKVDLDFA